jgi:hypothetical protein
MIASRNVALPHGKNKKTTKRTVAATETTAIGRQPGSPRTAAAIASGASAQVAMINRNAVRAPSRARWRDSHQSASGVSTRNAAQISATPNKASSTTAKPLARLSRKLIAYRDGEDDDQHAGNSDGSQSAPTRGGWR